VDGDLVDIDGTSPVYFKNVDSTSNYVVSVRHRNHLGLSSNPATALSLGLKPVPFDFSNPATPAAYYGNSYTTGGGPSKILLYSGNVYLNTPTAISNYIGVNTDRAQLLIVMGNASNAVIPARNITTAGEYQTYGIGDINFDRKVDYIGASPDRAFLLSSVMGSLPLNARTQSLPN
jgi:hypothetical protein